MRFNDAILGTIIAAFAVFIIAVASTFPGLPGQDFGPAFFPTVLGCILLTGGLILIISGIRNRMKVRWIDLGPWAKSGHHVLNFVLVPVSLLLYIFASDFIGFIPISIVILFVLCWRFGLSLVVSLSIAVVTTLIIHTVFYKFLLVPLPWGLLEAIEW